MTRHDGVVQVDTCDTSCDKLRRLDTFEGVHGGTTNHTRFTLGLCAALDGLAIGVEEAACQLVTYVQFGGLAVEHYLRVGCDTLGTGKHLENNILAVNLYNLSQFTTYGSQLVITNARSFQSYGSLGNVVDFGVYFLKCFCCHIVSSPLLWLPDTR